MSDFMVQCPCYIHSLKDKANDRHVLGEVIATTFSIRDYCRSKHLAPSGATLPSVLTVSKCGCYAIIKSIGDNLYLADYNGVRCTAIYNFFNGHYFVDDVYGVQSDRA
jgi:hypothetical protein